MPFVVYVAPNYTENAVHFIQKISAIENVSLGLISQEPLEWLPMNISNVLAGFHRVENIFDADQLLKATRNFIQAGKCVHRIFGAVEQIQVQIAKIRQELDVPGMNEETMLNFRDKSRMKELIRDAGLPCARHRQINHIHDARSFAENVGFPIVFKPLAGAASQSTYQIQDIDQLETILGQFENNLSGNYVMEEFIMGDEFSFDTFMLKGKPLFHSLTEYHPNPLHVIANPWIQWQVLLPREVDDHRFDGIKSQAFQTLRVLGMDTGMTHLEWFRREDGSIAISEVAARPPGAQIMTLISRANDVDAVSLWAKLMIFDQFEIPTRKYASGAAFLRGQGTGRVKRVTGWDEIKNELSELITDYNIPKDGDPKSPSYEGEGYVILRHEKTQKVKQALEQIISRVRVELG